MFLPSTERTCVQSEEEKEHRVVQSAQLLPFLKSATKVTKKRR